MLVVIHQIRPTKIEIEINNFSSANEFPLLTIWTNYVKYAIYKHLKFNEKLSR